MKGEHRLIEELLINYFKKSIKGICFLPAFFLFLLFMMMGAIGAVGTSNAITLQSILASEECNSAYVVYFQPIMNEVLKETNITIELSWVMTPYLYVGNLENLDVDEVKTVVWNCVKKEEDVYSKRTFNEYYEELIKIEKFQNIDKEDFRTFVSANSDSDTIYYGNLPEKLDEFKKIKINLPVEKIEKYYDIGMYDPFNTGLRMHYGVDISIVTGTPLLAPYDGTITYRGYDNSGGGNIVIISNGDLHVIYMHLKVPALYQIGYQVKLGEVVGYSGATGNVTGPHLHFQACAAKTSDALDSCVNNQKDTFFNPKLLWDF